LELVEAEMIGDRAVGMHRVNCTVAEPFRDY
jgi:hypothetical protein